MFLFLYNSKGVFEPVYEYLRVCAELEKAGDGKEGRVVKGHG